jgi:endo-1,4-beta-xylanase
MVVNHCAIGAAILIGSALTFGWLASGAGPRSLVISLRSADRLTPDHRDESSSGQAFASFVRPQSLSEPNRDAGTLRAYAAKIGLYFGSMQDSLAGNGWETPWMQTTLSSEFNLMEPGNQLKWWMIEPDKDKFDFGPGDDLVNFAALHNMKVRGHNLLWGMANPGWLGNEPARTYTKFSARQLKDILINHIRTVIGHYRQKYPGIIKWWDVTNEVMGWNNRFNSDRIEWTKIGSNPDRADYLRIAFRTARAADPDAVLCMNDWGNEGSVPVRTENMIHIVKSLRGEGIPIDCVGMEAHLNLESPPSYEQILEVMKAYAVIGVQVQVTEFDIQARRSDANWSKASAIAAAILRACVDSANCTAFNNWGFSQSIYRSNSNDTIMMLPWNTKEQIDPEYSAMLAVLKSAAR